MIVAAIATFHFFLPVKPMPTPRPRARVIAMPGRRPIASMYSPKEYATWQKEAAYHLDVIVPELRKRGLEGPHQGSIEVTIDVQLKRPKTTKLAAPKPDVDNYAKGVLDSITKDGSFWGDDTQVTSLHVTKRWAETSGYAITIRNL
nr:RusA family crossover junction endodeoxyribonuclease [uncultured Sphingomonas sp.]